MASVHKVKKSRFWFGLVSLPGGERIFRSTGETDKGTALTVALQWEKVAKGPPKSKDQARRVVEDIIRLTGVSSPRATSREFARNWLQEKVGTVSAATESYYRQAINGWLEWLGARADLPVDAVQREQLVEWRAAELKKVSPATVNQRMKAVRLLLKAAALECGFVNPATEIKRLKKDRDDKKRRPFTREELERVMAACHGPWRLMVLIGVQTGQRLGDIARMRWKDLVKGQWHLSTRKTGGRLRIPLSKEVLDLLEARKTEQATEENKGKTPGVFPELEAKITDNGVGRLSNDFGRILFKAGLRAQDPHDEHDDSRERIGRRRQLQELSFHSLRHTARTWLEEAGQPKAVIDALIGHEGDTGKIYTTVGEDALRNAAAALVAMGK